MQRTQEMIRRSTAEDKDNKGIFDVVWRKLQIDDNVGSRNPCIKNVEHFVDLSSFFLTWTYQINLFITTPIVLHQGGPVTWQLVPQLLLSWMNAVAEGYSKKPQG